MTDRNQLCPCGSGRRYKHCHGALDAAKGASSATPESLTEADTLIRDALAAHQRGDLDRAERAYRKVLEAIPTHPLATHYLGVILYQHSRFAEALHTSPNSTTISDLRSPRATATTKQRSLIARRLR